MDADDWAAFRNRLVTVARMGAEEFGLVPELHPHAGGFMDFEPEVARILDGEKPEDITIEKTDDGRLVLINKGLEHWKLQLPDEYLKYAELVD